MKRFAIPILLSAAVTALLAQNPGDKNPAEPAKPKKQAGAQRAGLPPILKAVPASSQDAALQRDLPVACAAPDGAIWIAYTEHDAAAGSDAGGADSLWLARLADGKIVPQAAMSAPGIVHQPAVAAGGDGAIWCVWGETAPDNSVDLKARPFAGGSAGEAITLADSAAGEIFADAGTDPAGRVWVAWQSMRAGEGDIFVRYHDPGTGWSGEIAVCAEKGGDWEPRLAFTDAEGAWVIFDSSRGNEFNLYLARVGLGGAVKTVPVAGSPRYEGRASIAAEPGGEGLWIAAERGRVRWGLDARGHGNNTGLNAQKEILVGRYDVAAGTFTEHPPGPAGEMGSPVNLPALGIDAAGNPWLAYRYYSGAIWDLAVTRLDVKSGNWGARRKLGSSAFGQDRRADFCAAGDGLWLAWPSDGRTSKAARVSGVFLGQIDTGTPLPDAAPPGDPKDLSGEPFAPSQNTPERPKGERHVWDIGGKKVTLVWGDVHRHTDVSNCRTGFDGCITEHFRYAYDMAKLDFLGTSDHTDVGKPYHPYEWWHNQRMMDAFFSPEQFVSLYVYEREQRWPWGHRNVVFAQRGGPVIYIKRALYRNSPWQKLYPAKAGIGEIEPPELWSLLQDYGKPVALVSHTGATGMGTDWAKYDEIEYDLENLVEIFQGARVSYEGIGAPQPTAGLKPGQGYTPDAGVKPPPPPAAIDDFGKFNPGVYQRALALGHRLGVFASSDHISQHVSYGGVYVEDFSREGIINAFKERRTVAATDKIYLELTCNGHPLGSIFDLPAGEKPQLAFMVDGTATLKRVTLVRNEQDLKAIENIGSHRLESQFTDDNPPEAEARYYLRVEQEDGNMAWTSPVWVGIGK